MLSELMAIVLCLFYAGLALAFFALCWNELESRRDSPAIFFALILGTSVLWPFTTISLALITLLYETAKPVGYRHF